MAKTLRCFLLGPLAIVYGVVTFVRNRLYDWRFLTSYKSEIPTISVGNLAVGGTGKTPFVELLTRMLQNEYKLAVLSRGYKRKTNGYVLASNLSVSSDIGDEPFQIFRKFPGLTVAVSEKRKTGLIQLSQLKPAPELVLLDDAFQHRAVTPGLSILLTPYEQLYVDDYMLPAGNLREFAAGSKRADIIVVTKCPHLLSDSEMLRVKSKLAPELHQQLYFSSIEYGRLLPVFEEAESEVSLTNKTVLLITGIVSNKSILDELKTSAAEVQTMVFSDHHHFSLKDYAEIEQKFINLHKFNSLIVTTEKDAVRMICASDFPESLKKSMYYLPISFKILEDKQPLLEAQLKNYVTKNRRNS